MPELDHRHERIEDFTDDRISAFASRLHQARVVLEEHASLPAKLERLERGAEVAERDLLFRLPVPVIVACALTWKMNSGRPLRPAAGHPGSGRW